MKRTIFFAIIIISTFFGKTYSTENKSPIEMTKSNDLKERIDGFYALADTGGPFQAANCKFKVSDAILAKRAVIDLLRRERNLDKDSRISDKYVENNMLHSELYAEYFSDLMLFVDSCEDESATDLFPGDRTFNKYPGQTAQAILSTLDNITKTGFDKNRDAYVIRYLGKASVLFKKDDKKLYEKVKAKLIGLADDKILGNTAVETMGRTGDLDFIPTLQDISRYDNTRGTEMIVDGKKRIFPISKTAARSLKKLQQNNSLPASTTAQ